MRKLFLFLLAISPTFLSAHPGHDFFNGASIQHYLTSPIHVVTIIAIVLIAVMVSKKRRAAHQNK
jgi:hypothetical protein